MARRRDARGGPALAGLFLSSYHAPVRGNPRHAPEGRTHALPDAAFIDVVRRWGFFPDATLADADLMRYVLPPLRADLRLDEPTATRPARRAPCVVYGGTRGASVAPDDPVAAAAALRAHAAALDDAPARAKPGASGAFCFAGQGSQHAGMARDRYRANAAHGRFRHHFDADPTAASRPARTMRARSTWCRSARWTTPGS